MERDFKGVWIPKEIWLNPDLTLTEKVFLVEIDSLDNDDGCYASNKYFSEFFDISKGRCTQIIKSLEGKGYLTIGIEREGKEITKRTLRVVNKLNRVVNILNTPSEKTKYPYLENDEENNTSISNTSFNNTYEEILDSYHLKCPKLPKVQKLTDKRKKALKAWGNKEEMKQVFTLAGQSDFLNGSNGWMANFDWIIKPENRVKILEGNYQNKSKKVDVTSFNNYDQRDYNYNSLERQMLGLEEE